MQSLGRKIVNFLGMTTLGQKTSANSLSVTVASDIPSIRTLQGYTEIKIRKETSIGPQPLSIFPTHKRVSLRIQNRSTEKAYIGTVDTVDTTDGWELLSGGSIELFDTDSTIYVKPETTTPNVIIIETIEI